MRRKDRENNAPSFIDAVLNQADCLFLAMHAGEFPLCLPFNYVKLGNSLYIHSAPAGHKLECLANDNHVAFCAVIDVQIDNARATTCYKSICGRGIASLVGDKAEQIRILKALADRYNAPCARSIPEASLQNIKIISIEITEISGKENLPSNYAMKDDAAN